MTKAELVSKISGKTGVEKKERLYVGLSNKTFLNFIYRRASSISYLVAIMIRVSPMLRFFNNLLRWQFNKSVKNN